MTVSNLPCVWTDRTCRPEEVGSVLSVSAVTDAEVLILWVICWLVVAAADKKRNVLLTAQSVTASTTANMSFTTLQHYLLPLLLLQLSLLFLKLILWSGGYRCMVVFTHAWTVNKWAQECSFTSVLHTLVVVIQWKNMQGNVVVCQVLLQLIQLLFSTFTVCVIHPWLKLK